MTRPKRSAAMAKPKSFAALYDDSSKEEEESSDSEVKAASRKRSRAETTTPKNHDSASEADPTIALNAALERMVDERARDKVGELEKKMNAMREEMNALNAKQRTSNDELQRLRTELAKEKALNKKLKDGEKCDNSSIGVKKIGELDVNVFKRACEKRFPVEEAAIRGVELCSTWQDKLKKSDVPYLYVRDSKGNSKAVVNEKHATLCTLKNEWGDEAYNALATAFMDLHGCMLYERVEGYEIWNFKENRKAKLEEVISWLRGGKKELLETSYVLVSIK